MLQIPQKLLTPVVNAIAKRTKISPEIVMAILTIGIPLVYQAYKSRRDVQEREAKIVIGDDEPNSPS